jgi:ABC-2 type transport system ATP-binding protein
MQRRLELACALVHSPAVLFLDEPTAGIDPLLRTRIWDEVHRLRDEGRTLVVTTQYVGEAQACDTVALFSDGRLIALAAPDELRRSAIGGDLIELETTDPIDASGLTSLTAVHSIERLGPHRLRVIVDDASTALPDVVEAASRSGVEVASAREVRPSFDTVFAALVERDRAARGPAAAASA